MNEQPILKFISSRKFGVELELNSLDRRDFKENPLKKGELPLGAKFVAEIVSNAIGVSVDVNKWGLTHDNQNWVVKPDSSCGIEVCSGVLKGWRGIKKIVSVVNEFKNNDQILIDDRCSLHVHVNVGDLNDDQIASIISYWIKCEAVFMDSVPDKRKNNRYCQLIGQTSLFDHDSVVASKEIIRRVGMHKYYSINSYHCIARNRPTIEFRITESEACKNPDFVKNWLRLIIHFVEMTKQLPLPAKYDPENPFTGFSWLDPKEVLQLLLFDGSMKLSPGMEQTKKWFITRLKNNSISTLPGCWSPNARIKSINQIDELYNEISKDIIENTEPLKVNI